MAVRVLGVIPARLGSTRFPGKVIHPYRGRPLLYYLWRQLLESRCIDRLIVATDSPQIRDVATAFGAEVVLTSKGHRTGSDRVAEVAAGLGGNVVVNIQGDCFGLKAPVLDRVITAMLADQSIGVATLARPIRGDDELFDPGVVKLVTDAKNDALWFSRFPLPYLQKATDADRWRQFKFKAHIGVYFFRSRRLRAFAGWKQGQCEKAESLEQLRILENGGSIRVFNTTARVVSVDTPADLDKIARVYE
jgi:3-deoxy-manno-octulosonate cytidylyltransferase (CMP-KDO synthetase)